MSRTTEEIAVPAAEESPPPPEAVATTPAAAGDRLIPAGWLRQFVPPLTALAGSRLVVLATLYAAGTLKSYGMLGYLKLYDATNYLYIAQHGYPQLYGPKNSFNATAAFFPALPLMIRATHIVTRLGYVASGALVANLASVVAVCMIWLLVKDYFGDEVATRTSTIVIFWPASFVLSTVYSDGVLLAAAAGCLLALHRQRWLAAGLLALVADATRPNGIVLVLCCAWAAVEAWRRSRTYRPLIAVFLAPLGSLAYFAYTYVDLGSATAWFTAEHRGWGQGFDFGHRWLFNVGHAIHNLTAKPGLTTSAVAGFVGIALILWMLWARVPALLSIYAVGIMVLALGSGYGLSIPRFCMEAFPMFIPAATKLRGVAMQALVGVLAAGMVMLMLFALLLRGTAP